MKKMVLTVILSVIAALAADAQKSIFTESDMKAFSAVNISDEFVVTLKESEDYVLKTNIDERIDSYVAAYVKDGVLYLDIERKKFTPELKKALRNVHGKNPVIEAEIWAPFLKSVIISGNVAITGSDDIKTDSFELNASDKASVANMEVICKTAEVKVSKGAEVDVEINASSDLSFSSAGTSKTFINVKANSLTLASSGSSTVEAVVDVEDMKVDNSGMSNVKVVSGKTGSLMVNASGSAKFNSGDVVIPTAYMIQSGSSKSLVNVSDTLKVNLVGNSTLEFKDNPYIDLERIVSSTLTRYSESSK